MVGKTIEFEGTDDYIVVPNDPSFIFANSTSDKPFTITAWIYKDGMNLRIVSLDDYSQEDYELIITSSNEVSLLLHDGSVTRGRETATINNKQWYYVVATYDGRGYDNAEEGIDIYLNGEIADIADSNTLFPYIRMSGGTEDLIIGSLNKATYNYKG